MISKKPHQWSPQAAGLAHWDPTLIGFEHMNMLIQQRSMTDMADSDRISTSSEHSESMTSSSYVGWRAARDVRRVGDGGGHHFARMSCHIGSKELPSGEAAVREFGDGD
jgi:hypothetical protein